MIEQSFKDILDLRELGGELAKIRMSVRSGRNTCVFSATLSQRVHLSWGMDKPLLFVTQDRARANQAYSMFKEYFGDCADILIEREDGIIYRSNQSVNSGNARARSLSRWAEGKVSVMVITPEVLLQYLPKKDDMVGGMLSLKVGEEYDTEKLSASLIKAGYTRRETIENRGEFAKRGDILTLFPSNQSCPLRLTFFGDELESIKEFDLDTMESIEEVSTLELYPNVEFNCNQSILTKALEDARAHIRHTKDDKVKRRAEEVADEVEVAIQSGNTRGATEFLLPYIKKKTTIFEYLDRDSIIVFDEPRIINDKLIACHKEYIARYNNFLLAGDAFVGHKDGLETVPDVVAHLASYTGLSFANMASVNPLFKPMEVFNLQSTPMNNYYMNYQSLFADLKNYNASGYKIIISCGDAYTAKHIRGTLYDENIFATDCSEIDPKVKGIILTAQTFSHGFIYKKAKLVVIGKDELIRKRESLSKQKKKGNVFTVPKCGDYVVHEVHGIGMCAGVERIKTQGVEKDFVIINYSGVDKLYVPVDQMDRLSRYSGSDVVPKLSKIGGKEFQKVKDKVKLAVKAMAFDLAQLYRQRQEAKGYKYGEDTVWQKEFEDAFEYQETADQLKAIAEIKADMEKGVVMDRLLCGDVGYGKTEVALRAVFKTVMEGKQAAILAPTAILARQHFNTAMARFNDAKLHCVLLSRFQSKEEIEKSLKEIASGKASVIIGTHRLLSDKIKFKDLGLLVLDEEQRFGVEHKEKLKVINNDINVLTLSATPIPRTLNMALSGIRDISVLETPPMDRLPIETCVAELSDSLLEDAIGRELRRDGQVYVLYNRVEDIETVAAKISRLVPEAKVVIGHGQMTDTALENAIDIFYRKQANVLVATTIIENGIDLPDANTLIVLDADRLGLSALYQLRGRVGRSTKLAYAYFTTRENKVLTEDAMKRLTAIMDYTDFGSGFKIAMRDLEIRGAGNVLGSEQHGHIVKVGYDMYCKLLKEAVSELSGDEDITTNANCEMNVDINSYLDSDYIPNNNEKIKIYKEIAEISSEGAKKTLISKLTESYGMPSEALTNLIEIALIKNLAAAIGARKVTINAKGAGIAFEPSVYKNRQVIIAVSDNKDECVLTADNNPTIIFNAKNLNIPQKMEIVKKFLLSIDKI